MIIETGYIVLGISVRSMRGFVGWFLVCWLVPNDGKLSEFVSFIRAMPLVALRAIGLYGESGREMKDFIRRIADHYIGDRHAKEWLVRRMVQRERQTVGIGNVH